MKRYSLLKHSLLGWMFSICISSFSVVYAQIQQLPLELIKLPPGFEISIYSAEVPNAREMALGNNGILFVGTRALGKVYAVIPNQHQTAAKQVITIARHLNMPNGVAMRNGDLYVAEVNRVIRFDQIEQHLHDPPKPKVINDKLPSDVHHGWRFIRFSPDDWLYVPVGAPCNVCLRKDNPYYASILRMRPNGSDLQIYAQGVRNTVGFDWHPTTKELWFTDNGRDWLGDDIPPDELNYAPKSGMHFGFPYFYGKNGVDPEFGKLGDTSKVTPAAMELGPHVAALGMSFYTGNMFPAEYHHQIFIPEHGSWNRTQKIGYRVTLVTLQDNKPVSYKPFATGWLQGDTAWGRPIATLVMPDGALLVSDDHAGAIYRISYNAAKAKA